MPCPYCGEEILAVAKKCKHCGEWLDGSHKEPAKIAGSHKQVLSTARKARISKKTVLNVLLMFICAMVLAIAMMLMVIIEADEIAQCDREQVILGLVLGIVLLGVLGWMIVNNAIRHKNSRRALLLMIMADIEMLSIPVSLFIGCAIWRSGVISGKYGVGPYPFYDQTALNAASLIYGLSLLIFVVVAIAIVRVLWKKLESKESIKRLPLYLGLLTVVVAVTSIGALERLNDYMWYFKSEPILQRNIDAYTDNVKQLYELTRNTNDIISRSYSDFLTGQISDFSRGDQETLPPTASLQQKSDRFREMKDWLNECRKSSFCNSALIGRYYNILNAQEAFANKAVNKIDKGQIEKLQKNIRDYSNLLGQSRVFSREVNYLQMDHDVQYLGERIIRISQDLATYPDNYRHMVDKYGPANEEVTTKMQTQLAEFEQQLQEYEAKFPYRWQP